MSSLSRRKFVLGGATVATIAAGACMCTKTGRATITGIGSTQKLTPDSYTITKNSIVIDLDKTTQLNSDGNSVKIKDDRIKTPLIIVRLNQDDYIARSIKCTHRGVEVEYNPKEKCFKCASLGSSKYSNNGEKISGFAKNPLKNYSVNIENNTVTVLLT